MPRATGFTDAELAAMAWKRNVQLQATLKEAEVIKRISHQVYAGSLFAEDRVVQSHELS